MSRRDELKQLMVAHKDKFSEINYHEDHSLFSACFVEDGENEYKYTDVGCDVLKELAAVMAAPESKQPEKAQPSVGISSSRLTMFASPQYIKAQELECAKYESMKQYEAESLERVKKASVVCG